MKKSFRFFLGLMTVLGLAFVLSSFFSQNTEPLQLEFLGFRTKNASKGLVMVTSLFVGVLVTFVFTITAMIAKSIECTRLRRENQSLQKLLESKAHSSSSKA